MLKIKLTDEQALELARWRREPSLKPAERDRIEMIALSNGGWRVSRLASHLGYSIETVRRLFRRFPTEGFGAIRHEAPGPAKDEDRRKAVETMLERLLREPRTWTSGQLAEALGREGIVLSGRQVRRYLRRLDANWRRTKRSLGHKQNPEKVARAKETLAVLTNEPKQAG
jgi:transposase